MAQNDPDLENHPPCKSGNQIVYAWAKDGPELALPSNTGFRMGKDSQIKYWVLQVHYAHLDMIPESGDDSGLFLHYTDQEQPQTAGVLLMGTAGLAPKHSTTFFETACHINDARHIHPFAFRTHTHSLGKVVSGWKVTDKKDWNLIGKRSPQLPQMFYPVADSEMTLTKGDIVAARCTMVNPNDHDVHIGTTGKDEMCNFYIMYWVKGKEPLDQRVCFSPGPPWWSWKKNAQLLSIPDEEASTL
jgi:peptidylglycine monooxygenase